MVGRKLLADRAIDEEVAVLEESQHAQVDDQADNQQPAPSRLGFRTSHCPCDAEVD